MKSNYININIYKKPVIYNKVFLLATEMKRKLIINMQSTFSLINQLRRKEINSKIK